MPSEAQLNPSSSMTVDSVTKKMPMRSSFLNEFKDDKEIAGGESRSRVLMIRQMMQIGRFRMKHYISNSSVFPAFHSSHIFL